MPSANTRVGTVRLPLLMDSINAAAVSSDSMSIWVKGIPDFSRSDFRRLQGPHQVVLYMVRTGVDIRVSVGLFFVGFVTYEASAPEKTCHARRDFATRLRTI